MRAYEYMEAKPGDLATLNRLGREGWHVVATIIGSTSSTHFEGWTQGGYAAFTETTSLLLERELPSGDV
jgi:hypothetical protein